MYMLPAAPETYLSRRQIDIYIYMHIIYICIYIYSHICFCIYNMYIHMYIYISKKISKHIHDLLVKPVVKHVTQNHRSHVMIIYFASSAAKSSHAHAHSQMPGEWSTRRLKV